MGCSAALRFGWLRCRPESLKIEHAQRFERPPLETSAWPHALARELGDEPRVALALARLEATAVGQARRALCHVAILEIARLVAKAQSARELEEHLDLHAAPRTAGGGQLHEERAPVELHDVA